MALVFWKLCILVMTPSLVRGNIGKKISEVIGGIRQPIDETLVKLGSSQCDALKTIFGISDEQVEGEKEPDVTKLTLELWNNGSRVKYNITTAAEMIPLDPAFDANKEIVIYLHGFTGDSTSKGSALIIDAFIEQDKYNVLALDSSSLIRFMYLRSSTYIKYIGEKLGEVFADMLDNGVKPSDIHMVGHSMGAHISGFAGKTFFNLTSFKLRRISAVDPAGPCFTHVDPDLQLKSTDAEFVDVMHTDGGVFGLKDPIGHADFYPNGGSVQPNCPIHLCDHRFSWKLYAESILDPEAFPALKCDDWKAFKSGDCSDEISYMGYPTESTASGLYYLRTNGKSPYGLGMEGLQ